MGFNLSDLISFFFYGRAPGSLDILEDNDERLVIGRGAASFVIDAKRQMISRSGQKIASFEKVRAIVVRREQFDEDPEYWAVQLDLGTISNVSVGYSRDDIHASVVAARISTLTGKEVIARR